MNVRLRWPGEVVLVGAAVTLDLIAWSGDTSLRGGGAVSRWLVPISLAAAYLVLLARRSRPITVFAVQWVYSLAGLLVPAMAPFAGLFVALWTVARRLRATFAFPALAACSAPLLINAYDDAAHSPPDQFPVDLAGAFVLWALLTGAAFLLGRVPYDAERRAAILDRLRALERDQAMRTERLRLAQELHDGVAGYVSAIILQAAGAAATRREPVDVASVLADIQTAGVRAMGDLHELLHILRSDDAPDRTDADLHLSSDDLGKLVEIHRAAGLHIDVTVTGQEVPVPGTVAHIARRLLQEALTNAGKHGGREARVDVAWDADALTLRVTNTRGHTAPRAVIPGSGFGLHSIEDRVRAVGGTFRTLESADRFVVEASIPLRDDAPRHEDGWKE